MGLIQYIFSCSSKSAAVTFAVIFIAIGVPLWWKTTEVYRVSLPYSDIEALKQIQITQKIDVTIVTSKSGTSNQNLQNSLNEKSINPIFMKYKWHLRNFNDEEKVKLAKAGDIHRFDEDINDLNFVSNPGMIWVYVLDDKRLLTSNFKIGRHRSIFMKDTADNDVLVEEIYNVVRNVYVKEDALWKLYSTLKDSTSKPHLPDKEQMRSVHATPAYDITFSLVQSGSHVAWPMEDAIQKYLNPFINKLSLFADFDIKSQIFYLTKLNVNPQWNAEKGHHMLSPDQLPHVINPVEELLGSHVSTNPNLNLLVYIPPKQHTPLIIYNEQGQPSKTNAFLSPRWGGFLFYNINETNETLDMSHVMKVFITHIRKLVGLPNTPPEGMPLDSSVCSDWELDFLLRKRTLENVAISVGSLNSLAQLLNEIRNIVINDDVGRQVYKSVEAIEQSVEYLKLGDLRSAFVQSKISFVASEKAFFDPSMLKLLYFPDDQKYAIYIPLFLPVSIPILTSIFNLVKMYKSKEAK